MDSKNSGKAFDFNLLKQVMLAVKPYNSTFIVTVILYTCSCLAVTLKALYCSDSD
ncbi:MAG: hypothetical protein IPO27_08285 [Bacteroidetes bacterium]|nr:hypothetical protein [Bacteroidota bacterium]